MSVEPLREIKRAIGPDEVGCHVTRKIWPGRATPAKDGVNIRLKVWYSIAHMIMEGVNKTLR